MPKVLLIGWDAADWKIINPLLDQGLMPNLASMVNNGVMGNLATLDPMFSPMLWTSIATGKRPYQHGILSFAEPEPDGLGVRPILGASRKVKAIWNILTQQHYKTHVAGWWPSHPAEPINGICLSDFYRQHKGTDLNNWELPPDCVWPEDQRELFSRLRIHPDELTAAHLLPFVPRLEKADWQHEKDIQNLKNITAQAATTQAAFTRILRTEEWDFAAVYFIALDHYCHGFMKYHPPRRPHIEQHKFDLFKGVVQGGYRYLDMMLGRLLELAGEDTVVMLVSDHGFQPDALRPKEIPQEPAGMAYEHSYYGVICAKGPGIKKDGLVYGASLLDITPTLLTIMGLPVGSDMDGKVLSGIFEEPPAPAYIPSWEAVLGEAGMPPRDYTLPPSVNEEMVDQLADLGYVENQGPDAAKNNRDMAEFCKFNLARAYLDGNKLLEATQVYEELHREHPEAPWYMVRLATCYQIAGRLKDCRTLVDLLKTKDFYDPAVLHVMEGSLLLGEGQYKEALKALKIAEKQVDAAQSRIWLQIGQCYLMLGKTREAEAACKKHLALDHDTALAHQMLGILYYNEKRYEEAADSLLTAVGLDYNLGTAHFYLGLALMDSGAYRESASAFEVCLLVMPRNNLARTHLAYLYQKFLDNPQKAAQHRTDITQYTDGVITVVSGLPRSGTSMMMQMLRAAEVPIFTDEEREADESNPKGYYEHKAVKSLMRNKAWLSLATDKVVKIVCPLITQLPGNYHYRVIFMERDLHEILHSQSKMLSRLGKKNGEDTYPLKLMNNYEKAIRDSKEWLLRSPNVEVLFVSYAEAVQNPFMTALRVNDFLGGALAPERMAAVADQQLYREKNPVSSV